MIEACENLIEETESQLPPLPRLVPQKNKNEPRWLEDIKTLSRLKATLVFRITEDDLVAFKKYQTWTIILHVDPQGSPLSVYGVRLNPLLMQVWHKGNLEHSG
jgi:hypothetical protein